MSAALCQLLEQQWEEEGSEGWRGDQAGPVEFHELLPCDAPGVVGGLRRDQRRQCFSTLSIFYRNNISLASANFMLFLSLLSSL